jgi:hypothetical protein
MLPPLGIVFALIVGFMAAGVWGDADRAEQAVNDEASALRAVVLLSGALPPETEARTRALIRDHIQTAVNDEWPAMAHQSARLTAIPVPRAEALDLALRFTPPGAGQPVAQREIVASLQRALDARRQRIIVSGSRINAVKWLGLLALAALTLLAIAFVHSGNRTTAAVAMALFAATVAIVVVMLASQDRPFTGQLGLDPDVPRAGAAHSELNRRSSRPYSGTGIEAGWTGTSTALTGSCPEPSSSRAVGGSSTIFARGDHRAAPARPACPAAGGSVIAMGYGAVTVKPPARPAVNVTATADVIAGGS